MKTIDRDGLLLCSMQGDIFASSLVHTKVSSEIFIRRFMNSKAVKEFDSTAVLNDSLTTQEVFEIIDNEFGVSTYGSVKYDKEVLFWIGYLYRYMAYTYELSSKQAYKIIKPKELNVLYYAYHSFDCAQAIERIFEEKNIFFDIDKRNALLLSLMRTKHYEEGFFVTNENTDFVSDDTIAYDLNSIDTTQNQRNNFVLHILYNSSIFGDAVLNKQDSNTYKLVINFNNEKFKNDEMKEVVLKKVLQYAKDELQILSFVVELPKNDENVIKIFKNSGFSYLNESLDFVNYTLLSK